MDVVCKDEGKERKTKTGIGVRDLEAQLPPRGTQRKKTRQVMDFTYKDSTTSQANSLALGP